MGCTVKCNRHGTLALRLYWNGREWWEGLGLKATKANRDKAERVAAAIDGEIKAGLFTQQRYGFYFPFGNRAAEFAAARTIATPSTCDLTLKAYSEMWLPRQCTPFVRAAQQRDYQRDVRVTLAVPITTPDGKVPLGDLRLVDLAPRHLLELRDQLLRRGLALKSVRNMVDASLRAMYRDARSTDLLTVNAPFAALRWPRTAPPLPDPFVEAERDRLLDWFRTRRPFYYPFVFTLFHTGARPSELTPLRWADIDLAGGTITIRRSRVLGADAAPKTAQSARTIPVQPAVVAVLRDLQPLHADADGFVFVNAKNGGPIDQSEWPKDHWRAALRATGIRPRKFYATRHTFISVALSRGVNLKWLAEYCGTSVVMIERSYGRFLAAGADHQLALLAGSAVAAVRGARRAG